MYSPISPRARIWIPTKTKRIANSVNTPLIVLLIANLTQMVSNSVLVHNGYFREVARIGMGVVVAMTGVGAWAILAHLDIVQFLEAYVAVYSCGAIAAVVLMIRGPIRLAHQVAALPQAAPR